MLWLYDLAVEFLASGLSEQHGLASDIARVIPHGLEVLMKKNLPQSVQFLTSLGIGLLGGVGCFFGAGAAVEGPLRGGDTSGLIVSIAVLSVCIPGMVLRKLVDPSRAFLKSTLAACGLCAVMIVGAVAAPPPREPLNEILTAAVCVMACSLILFPFIRVGRSQTKHGPATGCAECGYNLRGNVSGVCPECGVAIPSSAQPSTGSASADATLASPESRQQD